MNKYQMRQLPLTVAVGSVLSAGSLQAATITVDSVNDGPVGSFPAECTLRAAVQAANTDTAVDSCVSGDSGADVIQIDPGLASGLIALNGSLSISDSVSILGPVPGDPSQFWITILPAQRHFDILGPSLANPITVSIDSMRMTGGQEALGGSIRAVYSDLSLASLQISSNEAAISGAAVAVRYAQLTIQNSDIYTNFTSDPATYGGAIYAAYSDVVIDSSSVRQNSVRANLGGGLHLSESTLLMSNSTVSRNSAYDGGCGVSLSGSDAVIVDSQVTRNRTEGGIGLGILALQDTSLSLIRSQVSNNYIIASAGTYQASGGGIFQNGGQLSLIESRVENNATYSAIGGAGGGIQAANVEFEMVDSVVADNLIEGASTAVGGGLRLSNAVGRIHNSQISGNLALVGSNGNGTAAGLYLAYSTMTISNTTISGNDLNSPGALNFGEPAGLLGVGPGQIDLQHVSVIDNESLGAASTSSLALFGPTWTLRNSLVTGASAVGLCLGTPADARYTLATDSSCTGSASDRVDWMLGPLADNGGSTLTHAIAPTSIALDAAGDCRSDLGIEVDQRGVARGSLCDVGAFEILEDAVFRDRFESPPS